MSTILDLEATIADQCRTIERLTEQVSYMEVCEERAYYWGDAALHDHRAAYFLHHENKRLTAIETAAINLRNRFHARSDMSEFAAFDKALASTDQTIAQGPLLALAEDKI